MRSLSIDTLGILLLNTFIVLHVQGTQETNPASPVELVASIVKTSSGRGQREDRVRFEKGSTPPPEREIVFIRRNLSNGSLYALVSEAASSDCFVPDPEDEMNRQDSDCVVSTPREGLRERRQVGASSIGDMTSLDDCEGASPLKVSRTMVNFGEDGPPLVLPSSPLLCRGRSQVR